MKLQELQRYMEGRRLLAEEIPLSQEELVRYEQEGVLRQDKSVQEKKESYFCLRCGNEEKRYFSQFFHVPLQRMCTYCRRCLIMGRTSTCTPLFRLASVKQLQQNQYVVCAWEGTLSKGQQLASQEIVQAVREKKECLVWAVCGAGKTEMLFAGIEASLQKGERVCIATPRTDVVHELAPRLQQAFPDVPLAALYGGSEDRHKQAPLTVTTTHQLLRYFQAFDTMIIDEVDAFPYAADAMLQYAVQQARKEISSIIFVTATPNKTWMQEVRRGRRKAIIVPARYHQHPLPVPSFSWCGSWKQEIRRRKLPRPVQQWVKHHLSLQHPLFLFVPHISHIDPVVAALQPLSTSITGVHAEDRERKEKVQSFRNGEIPLLVTTTILERGVTVANLQVAVLGAEEDIFTESALVQIAGRVGRNVQYPTGEVMYFHYGKTEEMVAAKQHIENMNEKARKLGWIS